MLQVAQTERAQILLAVDPRMIEFDPDGSRQLEAGCRPPRGQERRGLAGYAAALPVHCQRS